jgi:ATP-dependent DNA ligase
VEMLARETPTTFIAFDLLAIEDESLLQLPQRERRDRLQALDLRLTPTSEDPADAQPWLQDEEGVIAKRQEAPYRPGERVGMVKIKRVRTIDAVVRGWRPGKEEGTLGSLSLALYDAEGNLREVGHTSGFTAKQKRELPAFLAPYETGERFSAEPSRWNASREMDGAVVRPELVVEVTFDHTSNERIRHGAKLVRWRDDKPPRQCTMDQLDT